MGAPLFDEWLSHFNLIQRLWQMAMSRRERREWDRLLLQVKVNEQGCWIWQGKVNSKGYGIYGGKMAHYLIWSRMGGRYEHGFSLHHTCFEKLCCNPDHLEYLPRAEHYKLHLKRWRELAASRRASGLGKDTEV